MTIHKCNQQVGLGYANGMIEHNVYKTESDDQVPG